MNKKGASNGWILLIIGLVVIVAISGGFGNLFGKGTSGNVGTGDGNINIVTTSTTLRATGVDALQSGTSAPCTTYISVDGSEFKTGVTTVSPKSQLKILCVNNTLYHSAYKDNVVVPNSPTQDVPMMLYHNASTGSFTVFSTNNVVMTNGGGANNQTATEGGTYNHKVRFDGVDKASTNDMRCIIETSYAANTSDIIMSGLGAVASPKGRQSKPNWYSLSGTGAGVYVYDISPVTGAVSPEGNIQVISLSQKTLGSNKVVLTCYTKEWFLDSVTGAVTYDVEDSLGTLKSIAHYTYTWYYT